MAPQEVVMGRLWFAFGLVVCATACAAAPASKDDTGSAGADAKSGSGEGASYKPSASGSDTGVATSTGNGDRAMPVSDPPVDPPAPGTPEADEPAKPRCDVTKPFAMPRLVSGVDASTNTSNARLMGDELSIFFMRTTGTGTTANNEIWSATRTDRLGAFGEAKLLAEVSSPLQDGSPSVTADGLTMYLHSNRTGGLGGYDIWVSHRAAKADAWGAPKAATALNSASTEFDPFVRPDGKMLLFSSSRSKNYDIYRAYVDETGTIGTPTLVSELNTTGDESNPTLSADGLAIYFARGTTVAGSSKDVYVARRKTLNDKFDPATKIDEVSSGFDDFPGWISPDECALYLTVDNKTSMKEIYVAERGK